MLGFAMPSGGRRTFSGVLGYDEVEGKDGELLGVLASFVRRLFERLRDFERPRSLPDWTVALGELARELFAEDEAGSREIAAIQKALDALVRFAGTAGFSGDLAIASVRRLLERQADSLAAERGFLSGGVTFSAMVPMRSIPFRVVALLGMSDGAFPRSPRPVEFDLMQTAREVGDRSPRDDDRQLFLETLFAARERLIVTYSGRSVRDDRPIPASTCLAELLEALVGPAGAEVGQRRAALVVEHRLQGYSPAYFDGKDPRLFSYQREYESAATSVGESREARPFVRKLEPVVPPASIALADLLKFFKCPPAYLLNQRLGIYLKERRPEIMTRELLQVTSLEDWQMATPLIAAFLEDDDAERAVATVEARLRAEGRLPMGGWGQAILKQRAELCQAIAVEAKSRRGSAEASVAEVDVALDGLPRIFGSVRDYYGGSIVECGYSALGARYQLELWIRHLALCAGGRSPLKRSARVARDAKSRGDKRKVAVVEFEPLPQETARAELGSLAELFLDGQSRPLPFMPKESFCYVERLKEKKNARDALGTAVAAYDGSDMSTSAFDPHPQRAFDSLMPPFDARYDRGELALEKTEFHVLAHRVLGLLFAAKVPGSA
jgi:exodeoxyribonuclease V gamma subunit